MHSSPGAGLDTAPDLMEFWRWNRWIFCPAGEFWPELIFGRS